VVDHTLILGDLLVLQEVTSLVVVAAGGGLADQGLTLPILQEEDLAFVAHDVDGHGTLRDRWEMSHLSPPFPFLDRHAGGPQKLYLPDYAPQVLHEHQKIPFEAHVLPE
jgi:hypothetical protein